MVKKNENFFGNYVIVMWMVALFASNFITTSCTPAKEAATAKMTADAVVCVIEQYEKNPSVTPAEAAAACVGVVAEDAFRILVAHKRSKTGATPCSSASVAPTPSSSGK